MIKYAAAVEGNYDSDSTGWFDTYKEAEEFAYTKSKEEKTIVFIAEFIDGKKNEEYEDDEIEWVDRSTWNQPKKNYFFIVENTRTGKSFYNEGLYSSVEELKRAYDDDTEIYSDLRIVRAWEAKEVDL